MFNNLISESFVPFLQCQMKSELLSIANDVMRNKVQFILERNEELFNKFSSEHLRFKTYEKEYRYMLPQLFQIGEENEFVAGHDGRISVQAKPVYAAYVPLQDTLKSFLSTRGILKEMKKYMMCLSQEKNVMSNFIQGNLWLKKYHDPNKMVLPIFLYSDEFETRNPLGSHAGEEKLGGVYISIACLPPHLNAKLHNIFVSSIHCSKHLKKFGNEKIFRKTIEELNELNQIELND